jgi:hypothetical protein
MMSIQTIFLVALLTTPLQEAEQPAPSAGLQRLSFLLGRWSTVSVYPNGLKASGQLEYRLVLGGAWIRFQFNGLHPTRPVWEAHGMLRAQGEGFECHAFFSADAPVLMRGVWLEPGFLRLSNEAGDGGIDYHPRGTGVFQENWRIEGGERVVVMETSYQPL